jgi:predicted HAD superfamily Cof-like phosphohydrolase
MNMYNDVVRFIEACDQKPSSETNELYSRLINEEFTEFCLAKAQEDEVEQLDACMDMIWVILGFCHMKGYDVTGAWNEVSKSNLCKIDSATGKVIKRHDGKILKPDGWLPPDLSKFI